mmetsp:Transcript_12684/g.23908  ORF Transcript_12684/g.23908 Transcript_12684/m.23908 type:complete len:228 (+) Transcript_12684:114-797(+)
MGDWTKAGASRWLVSFHVSAKYFRRRAFSFFSIFSSTSSFKRLPSMFVTAAMDSACTCSFVRANSSLINCKSRFRIPSGKVKWCWMTCTAVSTTRGASCGFSRYMTLAFDGPRPGFLPVLPKLNGSGAPPGELAGFFGMLTMLSMGFNSASVAMTSGLRLSIAAQRRAASSCASFSMSSPKPRSRFSGDGLVLAKAHARRFCAPRSGGISGTWMFSVSRSAKSSDSE